MTTAPFDTQVLVVGGGPVGLVAAIEARLAGLRVTIVEPRDGVIDKACGEGLMPGALPMLARLGVDPQGMPLRGIRYVQGARVAEHEFRSGPGRGVRRTELHAVLVARASELGVERIGARVDAVQQDSAGVEAAGIRARWLLACDGLHSTVRRLVELEAPAPRGPRRYGLRRHYAVAPWTDLVEVHWARQAEIYVTPVSETEIGVAVLGPRGTRLDDALAEVPALLARLEGVDATSGDRGAGPFLQRATAPRRGRVLLVGDASGYVDAITGEGLRVGMHQAQAAVAAIARGELDAYDAEWESISRPFRVFTSRLVAAASSPVRRAIVPVAAALPRVFGAAVEQLAR